MKLKLGWEGLPTSIATYTEAYIPTLYSLRPGAMRNTIYDAYKFGFQIVFSISVALSVLMFVLTIVFMKHVDMDRKLDTGHLLDSQYIGRHWHGKKQAADDSGK
jgi:hypothetical protein